MGNREVLGRNGPIKCNGGQRRRDMYVCVYVCMYVCMYLLKRFYLFSEGGREGEREGGKMGERNIYQLLLLRDPTRG